MHAVLAGSVLLLRSTETVELRRYPNVLKPQISQEQHELRLRQSAGDSTRPQVNVAPHLLAKFGIEHDIAKLQPTARAQDAADFGKGSVFFRHKV